MVDLSIRFLDLFLHSCFGQIDAVNSTIRVGTQVINISDGRIRFERGTETKAKTPEIVEEVRIPFFMKMIRNESLVASSQYIQTIQPELSSFKSRRN